MISEYHLLGQIIALISKIVVSLIVIIASLISSGIPIQGLNPFFPLKALLVPVTSPCD